MNTYHALGMELRATLTLKNPMVLREERLTLLNMQLILINNYKSGK